MSLLTPTLGRMIPTPPHTIAPRPRMCPILGCTWEVVAPGASTCARCWGAFTGCCRGKERLRREQALSIQDTSPLSAYQCPMCEEWHNGHRPDNVAEACARALLVKAYLTYARGEQWVATQIERWDPRHGEFSRRRAAA